MTGSFITSIFVMKITDIKVKPKSIDKMRKGNNEGNVSYHNIRIAVLTKRYVSLHFII